LERLKSFYCCFVLQTVAGRQRKWLTTFVAPNALQNFTCKASQAEASPLTTSLDTFGLSGDLTEETTQIVRVLEELYRERLSTLIDTLYPPSASSITDFIDAFKITKGGRRG